MLSALHKYIFLFTLLIILIGCGGADEDRADENRKILSSSLSSTATTDINEDLYRFFVVAFDAAPGTVYMSQLKEAAASGMSIKNIVNVFTRKPQFTATFPDTMESYDFAQKLVSQVVGESASTSAKQEAIKDITDALSIPNWTRGDVIYAIFSNLAMKSSDDPKWGRTSLHMRSKISYAKYYTEIMLGYSTDLTTLKSIVAEVTWASDTALEMPRLLLEKIKITEPRTSIWVNSPFIIRSIAKTQDKKYIAAGSHQTWKTGYDWITSRFDSQGLVESNYGNKGISLVDTSPQIGQIGYDGSISEEFATNYIHPNPDGSTILMGKTSQGAVLAKVLYSGSVDRSYAGKGYLILQDPQSIFTNEVESFAPLKDGGLLISVGGKVYKVDKDGNRDMSFGSGTGRWPVGLSDAYNWSSLVVDDNGFVYAMGRRTTSLGYSLSCLCYQSVVSHVIRKFSLNGITQGSFGTNGTKEISGDSSTWLLGFPAPDNKILAVGSNSSGLSLLKFNRDSGQTDLQFDGDGFSYLKRKNFRLLNAKLLTNGKIVVTGYHEGGCSTPPFAAPTIALYRYNANGMIDTTFGTMGENNWCPSKLYFPDAPYISLNIDILDDGDIKIAGSSLNYFFIRTYSPEGVPHP